ncbi:TetM/TetW/TetO/TetS family tetracycline resistance ribosomal protection protein [Clostridium sp. NSJ-6]|uniref:TetM/TetW/TetO/TetS family tetracycline resistance ribosomal protection protein n=1 Tax=Clostridium hominis TaxID=2763036 RepID=A0ABR7DDC7_9CLOT|nr:TetM/TetW/TetO/TetS family tetracycline resistance ribosomal protection protein [Clostridium hominis]MBC5629414.1 TetM/TetW/TetO/TetS family tetracycline resistance ribosomal protection protein [Clostridium hominis]
MKKTIGILAHVDAGKTTFSEQVLYHTKSIRNRGRVDHKNSFLDSHNIEKERGITIFSDGAVFEFKDNTYYLVDTPGHIDFSTEMERSIGVMDYAIVLISAVEGVQGHTETVWQLLRKYNVPTFIFINKLDRVNADKDKVINEIKRVLSKDIFYIEENIKEEELSQELIEFISEYDETLLERYFEGDYDKQSWINTFKTLVKENKVFPCFGGSALQDEGIIELLNNLDYITFTEYDEKSKFAAIVYKIRHEANGNRVTFIKALEGTLKVRHEITYRGDISEKISSIRIYNGNKFKTVDEVKAGDIFAVTGLSRANAGEGLGELNKNIKYNMIPTLMSKVIFDPIYNIKDVLGYFKLLDAEDPALNVVWNESLQEIHVHIMGKIQLEILKEVVKDRFNLDIDFGPCKILYKETIRNSVKGYGHFEPLKHYAEVHLKLEALERNSGIEFKNKCHADNLTTGHMNLIRTHIFEREHHGVLTGSSLTDVRVTLLTGRAHNKHTEGGDFREATFRALRQGLEKADNVLLEPYYKFKIDVQLDYMGRVLSDIQKLSGTFNPPEINEDRVTVIGRGPVKTFMDYSSEVIAFSKGKGSINLIFDGYDECHNTEEVIEEIGYRRDADIEYSSSSIFCSKGQGYVVPWDKAEEEMHCEII